MNKWILLIFTALFSLSFLLACSSKDESEANQTITIAGTSNNTEESSSPVFLEVALNTVNMRKSPSMDSPVVSKLAVNSKIEWLNQISNVIAPVKLRGVRYNDPWLYVKNSADETGWVYAATIKVISRTKVAQDLKHQLLTRRIDTFFGSDLSTAITNYRQAYIQADSSERFANVYNYGQGLRDQLVETLKKKASASNKPAADMSWLDQILPGYSHSIIDNGKSYYLYADYQQMSKKAQQTDGIEDDQFIDFNLTAFTNGKETPELAHKDKQFLLKLDELTSSLPLFKDSLEALKNRIIK